MGPFRYDIDRVEMHADKYYDMITVVFWYRDDASPGQHFLKVPIHGSKVAQIYDDVELLKHAAEQAALSLGDSRFFDAVREYYFLNKSAFFKPGAKEMYLSEKKAALKYMEQIAKQSSITFKDVEKQISVFDKKISKAAKSYDDGPDMGEIEMLPGIMQVVKHPVTGVDSRIKDIIINLNDEYKWTREAVADWLESLDVDLRFQTGGATLSSEQRLAIQSKIDDLVAKIELFEISIKDAENKIKQFKNQLNPSKEES